MAKEYEVKAILTAKDKMTATMKTALGHVGGLGRMVGSGLGFGVLMAAGTAAFNAISGSVGDLVSEINEGQKVWKTFEGNMKMLGESDKDIASLKNSFKKYAQQTIYSSADMASTYSQLKAVGVNAADELVTGFAGLAASATDPQQAMKTLSQQATQMAGKPKVAWQDFKLMLEQTPAGLAQVAKEMGMSMQELVQKVQDGEVATEDFFEAVNRVGNSPAFQNMAQQYQTVDQAMDGLKETLANTLAPAFETMSTVAIGAIESVITMLEGIDGDALATKLSGWIDAATPAFNTLKSAAVTAGGAIKDFGSFCAEHSAAVQTFAMVVIGVAVAFKLASVISGVAAGVSAFGSAMKGVTNLPLAKTGAGLAATAAGEEAEGAASATAVGPTLAMAAAFVALGAGIALASVGLYIVAQAAIQIASAGPAAAVGMVAMVAAIAGLAAGAAVLGPALTAGSVGMLAFGAAVVMVGTGVMLASAGLTMLAGSLPTIAASGPMAAAGIMMLTTTLAMLTATSLPATAAVAALGVSSIASAAGLAAFGVAATASAAGVVALAGAAKLVASQLKSIDKSSKSASANLTAMVGSVSIVSEGLGALGEKANSAMSTLTNAFNNAASKAQQAGRKVGEGFTSGMKSGLSKAPSAAKSAVNSTISAMNSGYSSAYSAGQRIGKGFVDGLRSQLASVRSIAGEIKAASTMSSASYSMAGATLGGYSYSSGPAIIEIPVEIDGRQVAKATAAYTADELDKISVRNARKAGRA